MHICLRPVHGTDLGEIEITSQEFTIGRKEGCDLRLRYNLISRRHCVITIAESHAYIQDLKSRNGTFVNGEHVQETVELHDGDQLRLAKLEFQVVVRETADKTESRDDSISQDLVEDNHEDDEETVTAWLDEVDERKHNQQDSGSDDQQHGAEQTICIDLSSSELETIYGRSADESTKVTKPKKRQGDSQSTDAQKETRTSNSSGTERTDSANEDKPASSQERPLPWSRKTWR